MNLEVHHITPRKQGGKDIFDNAICLCFDCHADAGHYFADHPKGSRLSPTELVRQRDAWYIIVRENKVQAPHLVPIEILILNEGFKGIFTSKFVKQTTTYFDWNFYKQSHAMLGLDINEVINKMKNDPINSHPLIKYSVNKINDYDSYISFLNGDWIKKEKEEWINCQPLLHRLGGFRAYKEINHAACVLQLRLTNIGTRVLENYKLNLRLEKVIAADTVSKRSSAFDMNEYSYNVHFIDEFQAEFWPERPVLVQGGSVRLDAICLIPHYRTRYVQLHWEMLARDAYYLGKVATLVKPVYELDFQTRFIANQSETKRMTQYLPKIELD